MSYEPRSVPGDPGSPHVEALFEAGEDWLLAHGNYASFAAELMKRDGSDFQRTIGLTFEGRYNNTQRTDKVRIFISPEDAIGLADNLIHSAGWLLELAKIERGN